MAKSRRPCVGGNWKMNTNRATAISLAGNIARTCADKDSEVVVFPPFVYLDAVKGILAGSSVALGAQDVYFEPDGAFTGEISVGMLLDVGCEWVLCGHSERRHVLGESDELVNRKVRAALAGGLRVILCVGETRQQHESGRTDEVNRRQISAGLAGVPRPQMDRVVIAYEPVWAIGTGLTASPADASAAHAAIRHTIEALFDRAVADGIRIQYGGSVKASNASELFGQAEIDGGLIGGASLKAEEFAAIVHAAS